MKQTLKQAFSLYLLLCSATSFAASYNLPSTNDGLIGSVQYRYVGTGETVAKIAQQYDIGFNSIQLANPHLNLTDGVQGSTLTIPTVHLLPNLPRQGVVINLPEMRMYYFPRGSSEVLTYPIGIGKIGRTIPIIQTAITRKTVNPTWVPPDSIREYNLEQGIVLPQVMPPGPDNPLGPFAIYMRVPTYLIHSTIFPESVGKRASFGCIRMFENDIQEFFPSIAPGVPVAIINKPTKLGWYQNQLLLEVHPPLEEHSPAETSLPAIVDNISNRYINQPMLVDWQAVAFIAQERDGIPHDIGIRLQ